MNLEGEHTFDVHRDVLWEALLDPEVISNTLPGCEGLTEVGEHQYKGTFSIGIGPVQGRFEGQFALSDLQPPESYHLRVDGKGSTGFMEGEGDIRLEEKDGSTLLHYNLDVQVGGRVASIGQRLLKSSARLITRQGFERLHEQVKKYQVR